MNSSNPSCAVSLSADLYPPTAIMSYDDSDFRTGLLICRPSCCRGSAFAYSMGWQVRVECECVCAQAATWCLQRSQQSTCSTCNQAMCTGAQRTAAGSQGTATWLTALCCAGPSLWCLRGCPPTPLLPGAGRSSRSTRYLVLLSAPQNLNLDNPLILALRDPNSSTDSCACSALIAYICCVG